MVDVDLGELVLIEVGVEVPEALVDHAEVATPRVEGLLARQPYPFVPDLDSYEACLGAYPGQVPEEEAVPRTDLEDERSLGVNPDLLAPSPLERSGLFTDHDPRLELMDLSHIGLHLGPPLLGAEGLP